MKNMLTLNMKIFTCSKTLFHLYLYKQVAWFCYRSIACFI